MVLIVTIGLVVVAVLLEGLVLSILWGWFIVPAFALPALPIPYAIGLALLVGMLTSRTRKSDETPDLGEVLAHGLVTPFLFLGIGWIVKLFI